MSAEEQQLWDQLASVVEDVHPDAYACRLRVSLAAHGCQATMRTPWQMVFMFER